MNLQNLVIDENEKIYLDGVEIPNVKKYVLKSSAEGLTELKLTIDVMVSRVCSEKNNDMADKEQELLKLCRPLVEYLEENYDPYTEIVVSLSGIELRISTISIPF